MSNAVAKAWSSAKTLLRIFPSESILTLLGYDEKSPLISLSVKVLDQLELFSKECWIIEMQDKKEITQ